MLPLAWAQSDATSPPTRADVKAEARAANKARQLQPAGEGPSTDAAQKSASTKTKAERKAETLQARKEGKLPPAGLAGQLYDFAFSRISPFGLSLSKPRAGTSTGSVRTDRSAGRFLSR